MRVKFESLELENKELKSELNELLKKELHKYTLEKNFRNELECRNEPCDKLSEISDDSKPKHQSAPDLYPVGTILPWMNRIESPSGQFLIRKMGLFVLILVFCYELFYDPSL